MKYEGHNIGKKECAKIGYGSRGERYLQVDVRCTCKPKSKKRKAGLR